MKLSTIVSASVLLLAPHAMAWRIRLYKDANYKGTEVTYSGPGNPGTKCFSVGSLNNEISSFHYYAYNPEKTHKCCVYFYDSPDCQTKSGDWDDIGLCEDFQEPSLSGLYWNDDISSFKTDCFNV